jgi:outer membrane protein assembly factor BamB
MRNNGLMLSIIRNIIVPLLMSILAISSFGCDTNSLANYWIPPETSHAPIQNNSYKTLWISSNIYSQDGVTLGLAASNDKVYILGSTNVKENSRLNALDALKGSPAWKSDSKTLFTIFANDEGLYVGESGIGGKVVRYDPDTGKALWSKNFWDSGGVSHLIVYETQLNIYLSPDKHRVLRTSDGKEIFSLKSPPFFDSGVCGFIYQTPIYTDNTIYFRTERSLEKGEICAVDISTGQLRWKSDLGVISNVVANDDVVFVLVESGDLLALNPSTGKEIPALRISFDNKPFIFYNTRTSSDGYFLAYDTKNHILFVLLGDSRQLFAFKLENK